MKSLILNFLLSIGLLACTAAQADRIYNAGTQPTCTQVGSDTAPISATYNSAWNVDSLNRMLDRTVYRGDIMAYKIRWFNGTWSGWYVKGVNDTFEGSYSPITPTPTSPLNMAKARLAWVYFYDHQHQYIICK